MESVKCSSSSSTLAKAGKWSAIVIDKVTSVCEWEVTDVKDDGCIRSPSFWQSGTNEWCLELFSIKGFFQLFFRLLSSQMSSCATAELRVSLMWEGELLGEYTTKNATLNKPGKIGMLVYHRHGQNRFWIRGRVSIPTKIWEPEWTDDLCQGVVRDLGVLLDSGDMSDVVLCAGDTELRAHRLLLSARSPVFAAMFRHDTQEAQTGRVHVEDVAADTLQEVLNYIYTGRVPEDDDEPPFELLAAADKYGLVDLKHWCEQEMVLALTVDNAVAHGVIALRHSCSDLEWCVISLIKNNLVPVLGSDSWAAAVRENPEAIIKISRLIANVPEESK